MKTIILTLILSGISLGDEAVNVVWRLKTDQHTIEILKHSVQVQWRGKGQDELYIHILRGGVHTSWHPYMSSVAGLILEGLAMDARDREVPISIVGGDPDGNQRIRFAPSGEVEIIYGDDRRIILARKDAMALAIAVHREYLARLEPNELPEMKKQNKPDMATPRKPSDQF